MLVESSVSGLTRLFQLTKLLVITAQRFRERLDQLVNRLLPFSQIALGFRLQGLKRRPGETQKGVVVLLERFAGERLKGLGELMARLSKNEFLLFDMLDGFGGLRFGHR